MLNYYAGSSKDEIIHLMINDGIIEQSGQKYNLTNISLIILGTQKFPR